MGERRTMTFDQIRLLSRDGQGSQQPAAPGAMYVAQSSGVIRLDGKLRRYYAGKTIVAESDPLRRLMPARFRLLAAEPVTLVGQGRSTVALARRQQAPMVPAAVNSDRRPWRVKPVRLMLHDGGLDR